MEDRYRVTETYIIGADSKPTGKKKYRISDRTRIDPHQKHGVFEDKREADEACEKLNAEHK